MIKTKYGNILTEDVLIDYLDRLIGKVWKLLPLYEEGCKNNDLTNFVCNHRALMEELCAGERLVLYCGFYIELINKLECVGGLRNHKQIKRHIRESIDIIKKLKKKVGEWKIGQNP